MILSLQGKYLLANSAMSNRYNMSPQELVGKNQKDLAKNKAEAQKMLDVDRQVIEDNRRQVNQFSLASELGGTKVAPRTLRVTKIPYKDNGEPAVLAIGEDITELIETSRKHKERLDTMALENKGLKRQIALLEQQLTYAKFLADNKTESS
jgi:PAS domain S-box-containing protein